MDPKGRTVEQRVARIASRAHGVITRRELLEAGVTPSPKGGTVYVTDLSSAPKREIDGLSGATPAFPVTDLYDAGQLSLSP
ncbi:MAG TPA: type IV toxin-antitoxin system AbiEi family antitoxin domain-containing protein [Solirubrobacterales bacterium]|nr:type IV toxin-antitoxin system AbiEi family antitoxin domain-containing protein [Solirubrobacterales bacterium]